MIPTTLAFFTPQSGGSPNANQIDSLYKITLYIALVIFVVVEGALVYALVRFRARKGAVPAQIRGNTRLEIAWTVGAAVILVALAVITFVKLPSIVNPPNSGPDGAAVASSGGGALLASAERKLPPNGKALRITVIGRQYLWQYIYPGAAEPDGLGAPYSYETMVVPDEHDGEPRHRLVGRRARLVDPAARREVPGGPGLPQLHLVQDLQARHPTRASARSCAAARTRA